MLPTAALAAQNPVSYIERGWDGSAVTEQEKTAETYTVIDSTTIQWSDGWYVARGQVAIGEAYKDPQRVTVTGDVHLILEDNCTLTIYGGIQVEDDDNDPDTPSANSLTIYGQSDQAGIMGQLDASMMPYNDTYDAAIGGSGSKDGGAVTIHGGAVTAQGPVAIHSLGAGIGGGGADFGIGGDGGTVTIYGGTVTATGSETGGAGIGGGCSENMDGGSGGVVAIYGGAVTATGEGAGIGGGGSENMDGGSGGVVTICGGTVTATGSPGAGIGGGRGGAGGTVTITGGTVTATGSAGIGGGGVSNYSNNAHGGDGGTVTITGGTVTATGGSGAGIGGGSGDVASGDSGSFSTDPDGSAVIFTSGSLADIQDTSQQDAWQGVIFQGNEGKLYGGSVIPVKDFTIPDGKTLTVETGKTLVIPNGASLTLETGSTLDNNGPVVLYGSLIEDGGTVAHPGNLLYKVTGVALNKTSLTLRVPGSTETLTATVTPDNAADKTVTWSSDNQAVATVANGVVTAVGKGTAHITATAADGSGESASCTVTVTENSVYSISADTTVLDFGTVNEGYEAPAAKTVTITNAGNQSVTLTQPTAANYTLGALSKTTLAPADTATVTVRPNIGLTAGAYNETLTVYGQSDGYAVRADVELRFTVTQQGGGGSSGSSSGGGSGSSNYGITVSRPAHGTVKLSHSAAISGSIVTVTTIPDEGYRLDTLTVTDGKGNERKLTEKGGGQYTFVMPSGAVTVKAVFTKIEAEPEPLHFADVAETAWYADAVRYVYEHDLMNGTDAQKFSPDSTTSRSMIATILWRMAGSPVVNYAMDFSDVAQGQWYTEAIRWAASEGIVGGYGNGAFGTNDPITREQFAVMLYRFAQRQGYDVSVGENTNILSYADAFDVAEYAIPAMQWACGAGIVNGSGANLNPQGDATRAQAAAMLMRFVESNMQ